jgi:hypothetical protein
VRFSGVVATILSQPFANLCVALSPVSRLLLCIDGPLAAAVGRTGMMVGWASAGRVQGWKRPTGYTRNYLACKWRHLVPIWQPSTGSLFSVRAAFRVTASREAGAVAQLVLLLMLGQERVSDPLLEAVLRTLRFLAAEERGRLEIKDAGGIAHLIRIMDGPPSKVRM